MKDNQEEPRLMAQWIVSLAVSVVCCAVLFIVFAGYIVDLHDALTLTTVRLEVAQEKISHVTTEVEQLRRVVMPTMQPKLQQLQQQPSDGTPQPIPYPQNGGEQAPATEAPKQAVPAVSAPSMTPQAEPSSQPSKP